MFRVDTMAQQ